MRIDLHVHSTASDGTVPPGALMAEARAAGLDIVALTDHDTTSGWDAATAALPAGLTLVPGAEISCWWDGGTSSGQWDDHGASVWKAGRPDAAGTGGRSDVAGEGVRSDADREGMELHLLAYLFDPEHAELAGVMAGLVDDRAHRGERMVDLIRADGVDITWEQVLGYAAGGSVGRPHLARALVELGVVGSVDEAFGAEYLGARWKLPKAAVDVFEAVDLVRAAGGVPVFAHPRASKRGRVVPDSMIVQLAAHGLFGLEAEHTDHTDAERDELLALAHDLGLFVTGSSDYHGANKTVRLGARTTSMAVYERIVAESHGTPPRVSGPARG
ncbi:phosphatase [Longispora fulva]|uniref:Putative metal-dependent phosphoesterase TrpH n=1 Tax=Longispora fulva TaxID=619741 RepID=A0A8J7KL21_9ACTN|nr:PHP domain-containing protein [Longispora fulva]MBG6138799.1 putative metal-dependent phosphoesterase TrpH [Longispora fulva]GIG58294.1 phosphatase [Longispora fulva]